MFFKQARPKPPYRCLEVRYAVILAAGWGERLWPITSTRPKPLVPLPGGETLLTRLMRQLQGLVEGFLVVIRGDEFGDMVRKTIESAGFSAYFAIQEKPQGTGDAARVGVRALPRGVDEVLVVNGDLLVSDEILKTIAEAGSPSLVGVPSNEPWNYGVIAEHQGCLSAIREKPSNAPPGSLINAGIYLLPRAELEEALGGLRPSLRGEIEITDAVTLLARKMCIRVVRSPGFWLDIGRPWDLFEAYKFIWREKFGGNEQVVVEGEVEGTAVIRGPVYVARNAVIRSHSVVEGPAWIEGEVGPFARIRPWSFLLSGSRAATHTEIKASILMRGAKAPHLNYVGDSILGEDVNLGAGTVTANLRFDHGNIRINLRGKRIDTGRSKLGAIIGDKAQTGVNVSLYPGVRLGAYSWISPGLSIDKDVIDCVHVKTSYVVQDLSKRLKCPSYVLRAREKVSNWLTGYKPSSHTS
ncbi:MAG: bifunctional sugar-1-phosphate nucleotidylyltransferase/acetyltransferase [Pyrodictiaceae archaeon]